MRLRRKSHLVAPSLRDSRRGCVLIPGLPPLGYQRAPLCGSQAKTTINVFRFLATRALYTLPVVWLVVSVVFLLIHLVPGDPIQQMLGEGAAAADIQAARHAYGLDVPIGQQYLNYWKGVLHGDLGQSLRFNQNVGRLIAERYPFTMKLTLASLAVALLLSIPAGVRSARRRNRWDDRAISFASLLGLSFPNFALGPVLILFFAIGLGLLPVSGSGTLAHLVLPAITMGGALLAGAIVTETIFSWPGIGRLTIQAISNRDYYLVQGCILAIGLTYVAVNFLTDLLYSAVNPRIRQ